jgi:hypothetical protein
MSSTMVFILGVNAGLTGPVDAHAHHRRHAMRRRRAERRARRRALATRLRLMLSDQPRPWPIEPDAELA